MSARSGAVYRMRPDTTVAEPVEGGFTTVSVFGSRAPSGSSSARTAMFVVVATSTVRASPRACGGAFGVVAVEVVVVAGGAVVVVLVPLGVVVVVVRSVGVVSVGVLVGVADGRPGRVVGEP